MASAPRVRPDAAGEGQARCWVEDGVKSQHIVLVARCGRPEEEGQVLAREVSVDTL